MLLSGNEAVALAAAHAGVVMGTGYPGTPSTEILETLAAFGDTGAVLRWAPNEKVALEVGLGAAFAGARTLVTMKHVGLNVAADPLFTAAYTGVRGGMVVVTADDPDMHSSQNEQDSRQYAPFAGLPMLEPASSQEAYDFTRLAFELSERFASIVLLRPTTRICHSKGLVAAREPDAPARAHRFERDIPRFVMVPGNARRRHVVLEQKLAELAEFVESAAINCVVGATDGASRGVVAAGVAYQYVREVAPELPVLKLGTSWPLPLRRIAAFQRAVGDLLVVEELSDFTLEKIRAAGIPARGKHPSFRLGELSPDRVQLILEGKGDAPPTPREALPPPQPPVLCPGCPHRNVFVVLREFHLIVTGDIGCYTLGALPPLASLDTCVCMGASIGIALGIERVTTDPDEARRVVAVIGDSTFFHSGLPGVLDAVYNGSRGTLLILDNRTTAMTGGQAHPGTGSRLDGTDAPAIDPADVCRGLGVRDVRVLDPYDRAGLEQALRETTANDEFSVIVCRHPCLLLTRGERHDLYRVEADKCKECKDYGVCLRLGCPALCEADGHVEIHPAHCAGCGLCFEVCKVGAIVKAPSPPAGPTPAGAHRDEKDLQCPIP